MLEVLSTGPLNTVQDLGRPGHRRIGLCQGGAMDEMALKVANIMVGNPDGLAAIEIQTFPLRLRATAMHRIALTGADCPFAVGATALPGWWAAPVRAGEEIRVGRPRRGARAYLAVAGGIDVEPVLGSRSTDLKNGFGGFRDRDLRAGDALPVGDEGAEPRLAEGFGVVPPSAWLPVSPGPGPAGPAIRVLAGPEHDAFAPEAQSAFWGRPWTVTPMSDRMGLRLSGETRLALSDPLELRSTGILPGVVQVPPSGEPLVQLRDANAAGGYPRIGVVAGADLWRLAQARPGAEIRFVRVDHDEAIAARREAAAYLDLVRRTAAQLAAMDYPGEA